MRLDSGVEGGSVVSPHYDPMLAKVIAHAPTRDEALDRLAGALEQFEVEGVKTNIPFCLRALRDERFRAGNLHTGLVGEIAESNLLGA